MVRLDKDDNQIIISGRQRDIIFKVNYLCWKGLPSIDKPSRE